MLPVSEIFSSIDGEGIRTGYPVTFIRLYGCNLKCSYCDSQYACTNGEFSKMTVDEIVNFLIPEIFHHGIFKVTLTGGEPMIHPETPELIQKLTKLGIEVNVETNGSIYLGDFKDITNNRVIWTMDYKSIGSGENLKMDHFNFKYLRECDVLKFVVGTQEDLNDMKKIVNKYEPKCHIFVSPEFGKIEPKDIVNYIMDNKLSNVRVQLQLHKYIWDPNLRGV